jgi:hypothetical protein
MDTLSRIEVRGMGNEDSVSTLGNETSAFRVPNDLWSMDSEATCTHEYAMYELQGQRMVATISRTHLGDCEPGERVLIAAHDLPGPDEGWRLCQVLSVGGRTWER